MYERTSLIGSLTLEASERIILEDLSDDKLNLSNVSSVKFITGNQGSSGSFRMIDGNDTIQTVGGGINISARFIDIGNLASNGGNIEITTPSNGNLRLEEDAFIQSMGGDININADITTSILSPKALTLEAGSGNVNIQGNIGSQSTKINQLNITGNDILIDGQFSQRFFTKEDLTLEAQGNLGLSFGTEFTAGGNLNLTAQGDLKLNNVNLTAEQALVLQTPRVLETTSSSNLQAGTNLSLETNSLLFPSFANLSLKAGQNLNVLVEQDLPLSRFSLNAGGNLLLRSQLGNIISNGKIFPQDNLQGDVILEADQDITITNSRLEASRDLKLQAGRDINVEKSQLLAGRDANIIAASQVEIQDDAKSSDEAAIITAQRDLLIQGDSSINIQAFRNPTSIIESGNNLTLISDGLITGNVNFVSGGNFATISVGGGVGNFQQTIIPNFDTIISSGGDVNFGNYEGLALKVEAKGSITGGDININGPNPTLAGSDPDISLLTNGPGLVLRAGVEQLKNTPNISNQTVGGTNFTSPGQSSSANITVGNINTAIGGQGGSVTMSTTGNIKIGNIRTAGDKSDITTVPGFVDLQAMGDIEVKTINTSGSDGGDINIIAGRLFRATDSFLQPDFVDSNTNANGVDGEKVLGEIPTSIYATGVSQGGANISIKHGGRSFLIGPKFERDANGNLVFRDNIGNLLPYTVDESGRVRDADNNILTNIVIGTPIDKANIPVFTSFTAGAITSNQENAGLVTSFRDSPLESRDTNTFSVGGGRVQVTFDPQAIPSDEVVQRQLNQDDKNTICPPQTTVAFNQGKNTRGVQTTTISQVPNKDTCTTVNKENILKIAQ
ncbi:MAG: hypothetical protein HC874_26375 [Richelia sp. SL_2_1]|nr:hypothetical protein [Richelia sp. SL_2_1]